MIFQKSAYTIPETESWLNNHNLTAIKIHITKNITDVDYVTQLNLKMVVVRITQLKN